MSTIGYLVITIAIHQSLVLEEQKLITNQLGYVHRNEHLAFRSYYVIEIH